MNPVATPPFKDVLHKIEISNFQAKTSMHNQVEPHGWFPQNIERFQRLGYLPEGIL